MSWEGFVTKALNLEKRRYLMTATQSLKIYETLNKHFKNPEDAKIVVEQIEEIVENKVEAKKDILSTKEDILNIRNELNEKYTKLN